jgi:hypothetical protein
LRVRANAKTSNLVTKLINDENEIWDELINNPFCTQMKTAKAEDEKVKAAFITYMTVRILVHFDFGTHNELLYLLARFFIPRKDLAVSHPENYQDK